MFAGIFAKNVPDAQCCSWKYSKFFQAKDWGAHSGQSSPRSHLVKSLFKLQFVLSNPFIHSFRSAECIHDSPAALFSKCPLVFVRTVCQTLALNMSRFKVHQCKDQVLGLLFWKVDRNATMQTDREDFWYDVLLQKALNNLRKLFFFFLLFKKGNRVNEKYDPTAKSTIRRLMCPKVASPWARGDVIEAEAEVRLIKRMNRHNATQQVWAVTALLSPFIHADKPFAAVHTDKAQRQRSAAKHRKAKLN